MARPIELPKPWCDLATQLGGVAPMADRLGVDTSTIQRWARGAHTPNLPTARYVDSVFVEHGLPAPRWRSRGR